MTKPFMCISASTTVVTCWLKPTAKPGREFVLIGYRSDEADAFPGAPCLPGGMKDKGENLKQCAKRELLEETGLDVPINKFSFIEQYSDPGIDPRGEVISTTWRVDLGELLRVPRVAGADDIKEAKWVLYKEAMEMELAFNHNQMLKDSY